MSQALSRKLKIILALITIETLILYPVLTNPLLGLAPTYYVERFQETSFEPRIELLGTPIIKDPATIFNLTDPGSSDHLFIDSEEEYNVTFVSKGTFIHGRRYIGLRGWAYLPLGSLDPLILDILAITLVPNILVKIEIIMHSGKNDEDILIHQSQFELPQNNSVLNYTTELQYRPYYENSKLNGSVARLMISIKINSTTGGEIKIKFSKFTISTRKGKDFVEVTFLFKDAYNATLTNILDKTWDSEVRYFLTFEIELSALFIANGKVLVQKAYLMEGELIHLARTPMHLNISVSALIPLAILLRINEYLDLNQSEMSFRTIAIHLPVYRLYLDVHIYDETALNKFKIYIYRGRSYGELILIATLKALLEYEYIPLPPGIYSFELYPHFYETYSSELVSKSRSPKLSGVMKIKNWNIKLHLEIPAVMFIGIPTSLPVYGFLISYIGLWILVIVSIGAQRIKKRAKK